MGWLDDFKKGMEKGRSNSLESDSQTTKRLQQEYEKKRREEQYERQRLENLKYESDSSLLNKYKSYSTSNNEKMIIKDILISRGYYQNINGSFNK